MKRLMTVTGACLLVFAASASAAFQNGTYKGTTPQGFSIQVKVNQTKMLSAHYKANYRCKNPRRVIRHREGPADLPRPERDQARRQDRFPPAVDGRP